MTLPCWRPRNVLARMNRARNFPAGTDPSSRHAALIATALIQRGEYSMLIDEPEHCGISIAVTVELLWKARAEIDRLKRDASIDRGLRELREGKTISLGSFARYADEEIE